ncbi:MAG: hypothetical protein L3K24_11565 [Gammaproteobacteria bacterium]|nr:hypothetical protein [Gammaproteobacteria bacterium]
MEFFHLANKQALLLWCFLLSLSLLCVQGAKLHVHDLDHGHIHAMDDVGDHSHLSKAHFAHDTSHDEHHNGVISEVDISPDGVVKNANNSPFTIALIIFFFALVIFFTSRQLVQRCREGKLIFHEYYVLSPPLRAPPQH